MDAETLLDQFNAAFNRHDVDGMMDLMTPDCVFENTDPPPSGERFAGQSAVRQFWVDFFEAAPTARIDIEELFICGERAVQQWVYHWSADGFVRGVDVFRLRDEKIAEKLSYVKG